MLSSFGFQNKIFAEEFAGIDFGFFLLCEFFNLLTRAFFSLFVSSLTRAIALTQDYKTRGKRRS